MKIHKRKLNVLKLEVKNKNYSQFHMKMGKLENNVRGVNFKTNNASKYGKNNHIFHKTKNMKNMQMKNILQHNKRRRGKFLGFKKSCTAVPTFSGTRPTTHL